LKGKHHDRCSDKHFEIETQLAPQGGWRFVLELNAGRIHSMNTDGSDRKVIVTDGRFPDGVLVDVDAGHLYWTNMGIPNDQVVMSRTPGSFRTVLLPRGSSKPEWLAR
jgi:hypothetical protein